MIKEKIFVLGKKNKTRLSERQGSILAYSLIILAMMLAIATSISIATITEKKAASGTKFSMQSLQTADSGTQLALKQLKAATGSGYTIAVVFGTTKCVGSKFTSGDGDAGPAGSFYELSFFKEDGTQLACDKYISEIASITSVGTYKNTARAVSVTVTDPCGGVTTANANGIDYKTVVAEDGKCWLASNLGTAHIATSYDDPLAYGWLFQWGRGADGHQIITSGMQAGPVASKTPGANFITNSSVPYEWLSPKDDTLWSSASGNNPCPTGFRLPTGGASGEWKALVDAESIEDNATAFSSLLKLPAAGYRNYDDDGTLYSQGYDGYYWSSTPHSTGAYKLHFYSTSVNPADHYYRASGYSVRCVKN